MRDTKRIDRILKLIGDHWKENPDCRFGQMLINANICNDDLRLWQNEDDGLEQYLNELNKQ